MKKPKYPIFAIFIAGVLTACAGNSDSTTEASTTTTSSSSTSYPTTSATISPTSATLNATTGCITNVNTTIDSAMPAWAKDNFKCQVAYTSGTNYIFKSVNLPNHNSFYYCGSHGAGSTNCTTGQNATLWEALPGTNISAGTNVISTQNLTFTIPQTPTLKSGTLTSSQGGLVAIGITANGITVFNNAAAPPDTLAVEAATFDNYGGHPQNQGVFHHHAAVNKLSSNMNDSTLIGVALDGYLIYAEKCDNGTADTSDDVTLTAPTAAATGNSANDTGAGNGDSATSLDKLHGHTTKTRHMTTATYHYHYAQDPTATIKTLMGSYFRGTIGSVSN
ncbi:MAG: YHYH protein [Turneriella sp.]